VSAAVAGGDLEIRIAPLTTQTKTSKVPAAEGRTHPRMRIVALAIEASARAAGRRWDSSDDPQHFEAGNFAGVLGGPDSWESFDRRGRVGSPPLGDSYSREVAYRRLRRALRKHFC